MMNPPRKPPSRSSKPPPPPPRKAGVSTLDPRLAPPPLPEQVLEGDRRVFSFGEEIAFLEEEIKAVDPRDRRRVALLHMEVARLLEGGDVVPMKVEERIRKAVQVCPEIGAAQRRLRCFHRQKKRWDEAIATIDAELKAARDPAARAALHLERGRVLRDAQKKPAAAEDFAKAASLDPADAAGPEALRTLYAAAGDWKEVANVLERAAMAASAERALELRREAAVIRDHALDQQGRAGGIYDAILAESPADALAVAAAERLYAREGRWLDLAAVLVRRAEASGDSSGKFSSYMRAGMIAAEHLDDRDRAASWFEEAAKARPADPAPVDALADLHRRAGAWEAYERALGRRAELEGGLAVKASIAVSRAHVLAMRLSRRGDAIAILRKALASDPANGMLVRALDGLLAAEGLFADRVELEMLAAERVAGAEDRSRAFVRVGEAGEAQPGGSTKAALAYEKALDAWPANRQAFDGLRRIYERAGEWKPLADLLTRRIEVASDALERSALTARLAIVREVRLDDPAGAIEALERIRASGVRDVATHWDLQRLYASSDRWKEHVEALRAEAGADPDPARRADLLWRCGVVAEKRIGDDRAAWDAYEAAIEARPDHRASLEALARIAGEVGSWSDHIELADRAMKGLDAAEQADRLVATARIAAETLGDEEGAATRCRRALDIAPGHGPAFEMLRHLLERRGAWKPLAVLTEDVASGEPDPAARAALRVRLGDLLSEHLESPAEAVEAYRRALEDAPGCMQALEGLERVLMRSRSWDALRELLGTAAARAEGQERLGWLRKLAALLAWRLGQHGEAMRALQGILESEPYDAWALRQGTLIALQTGDWKAAAGTLGKLAESTADPASSVAYLKEEALMREFMLGEDATPKLASALAIKPDDLEALSLLEQRVEEPAALVPVLMRRIEVSTDPVERALVLMRAALALQSSGDETTWPGLLDRAVSELPASLPAVRQARMAAERRKDWRRVADLLEVEGTPDVTARPEARVEALRSAARIAVDALGDRTRASSCLERAFEIAPADARVVGELGLRLREQGDYATLSRVLRRHAASLERPKQAAVLYDLALVLRDRMGSIDEAGRVLVQLLVSDPGHAEAQAALGDIRFAQASWQKAIESYSAVEDRTERHSALWRHARVRRIEVLADKLGLPRDAERLVREALGDAPADKDLLGWLVRVLRSAQDWQGVEAALDQLIRTAGAGEAAWLWVERGRTAMARRDLTGAQGALARAAEISLVAPESWDSVRDFSREFNPDDAAHVLRDVLYHAPPEKLQASGPMRLLVAQLTAAGGKDAESEARLALQLMPQDVDAWVLLVQTAKDPAESRRALDEAIRRDPLRPEIYRQIARLAERGDRAGDLGERAAQVLTAMGSYEGLAIAARPPQGERKLQRSQVVSWVVHPDEPRAALELLALAGPKLASLFTSRDLGPLEPLQPGSELGRQMVIAGWMFGVERFDAFTTRLSSVTAEVILDERPGIVLGPSVVTAPQTLLRFHLGRVFSLIASGSVLARRLPADSIRELIDALAGQHMAGFGDPAMVQQVGKVLGWMGRRGIANAAREYASSPSDLSGWQAAAAMSANRGGLVACGDIVTAVQTLFGVSLPAPGAHDRWETGRSVPGLGDLLSYAVSKEYTAVRTALA